MSKLSEIEPKDKPLVIDLLRDAGVNVSNWANCKGGKAKASRNPKYCYEWAFVEDKKVVVLNLWYDFIENKNGAIVCPTNTRKYSLQQKGVRAARALRLDAAIQMAIRDELPIRVIVQKGKSPGNFKTVRKRMLDPVVWSVKTYNWKDGECILMQGFHSNNGSIIKNESAIDDLSDVPEGSAVPDRAKKVVTQVVIKRDNRVRAYALKRAAGRCEYCNTQGFLMENGGFYLEAHHIIALCDSGRDTVNNVIALCPQHHRQAHYGKDAESLEAEFVSTLKKLNHG